MTEGLHLPSVNACLNLICTTLLIAGLVTIKQGKRALHEKFMKAAFLVSALFLASYLTHHYLHGSTKFLGTGLARTIYFSVLIPHTILAAVVLPMILRTLYLARKERFEAHRKLAKWTFPIWLYVSVTGVIVYWMLYRMTW